MRIFKMSKLFFYLLEREREGDRERAIPTHWFTPQVATEAAARIGPKPGARNSTCVAHVDVRHPVT